MRRSRRRPVKQAVSLFPFLAVLISTMGVLIVLLVLAVKAAEDKAHQVRQQDLQEVLDERWQLNEQLETQQLRVEGLTRFRPEVQKRLADQRLRRSHLEEHIRGLQDEARQLQELWNFSNDQSIDGSQVDAQLQNDIAELDQKILETQQSLESKNAELDEMEMVYSIVPTRSIHGTSRRPIYVECSEEGLMLQPLGISLTAKDFILPITAGNPLDAALLAIRQHWATYQPGSPSGEPYPLLVIRPGGATAYAVARRAMQSWDDEFGYELVETEKQLDFGVVDNELRRVVLDAVSQAQRRQLQTAVLRGGAPMSSTGFGSPPAGSQADQQDTRQPSFTASDNPGFGHLASHRRQAARDFAAAQTRALDRQLPASERSLAGTGTADAASGAIASAPTSPSRLDGPTTQRAAGGTGQSPIPGTRSPSAPQSSEHDGNGHADGPSLADARGRDWALPTRTPGATAYRRPIRLVCAESEILVYDGVAEAAPQPIKLVGPTELAVDELVNAVWKQIESWGMAEAGGYWKPVLRVSALPDGKRRARDLSVLLRDSGLEIDKTWR